MHPKTGSQASVVHGFRSLQIGGAPGMHCPPRQVSSPLQRFESGQGSPSGTGVKKQPCTGSQASVVQTFRSLQVGGALWRQEPPVQTSSPSQTFPFEQETPSATGVLVQRPLPAVHLSTVQGFESSQLIGFPGPHWPAWQVSTPLHGFPSEQTVPFATGACEQAPETGLQESVVQGLLSSQFTGTPGWQTPFRQTSAPLHALASAHEVPFGTGVFVQPIEGEQASVVQALLSLQFGAAPEAQVPFWQVSEPLHWFPSEQDVPFGTGEVLQPVAGLQKSFVQEFPSLQIGGAPGLHTPPRQVSAPLQALPSEQEVPFATGV